MNRSLLCLFFLFALSLPLAAQPRVPLPELDRSAPGGTALLYRSDAAGTQWKLLSTQRLSRVPAGRALPASRRGFVALELPAEKGAPAYAQRLYWPESRRVEWPDEDGRLQRREIPIEERAVLVRVPGVPVGQRPPAPEEEYDVEMLVDSGDPATHLDMVVVGDGYTADEQGLLTEQAQLLVDGLFTGEPFESRRDKFNIYVVHLVSNESGVDRIDAETDADCATASVEADTVLDCSFCTGGVQRAVACNEYQFLQILPAAVPDFDFGVVLINASRPGGTGGLVPAFTCGDYFGEVVRHELGHYLGALADEYESCLPWDGEWPEAPNVTRETQRDLVPWADLIDAETPVPTFRHLNCNGVTEGACGWDLNGQATFCVDTNGTPVDDAYWAAHSDSVGLWEGGQYEYTGIFRPTPRCLMRSLDAGFCPVCSRELVRWIEYFAPDCVAEEEVCDGTDNDCDGETDEDDACLIPEDTVTGEPDTLASAEDVFEPWEPDTEPLCDLSGTSPDEDASAIDAMGEFPDEPPPGGNASCQAGGSNPSGLLLLLLAMAGLVVRRRSRGGRPRRR